MGSEPLPRARVSVVITVKNEQQHLARLLDSLLRQEPPFEVVLVDALSRDRTLEIAERWAAEHPGVLRVARKFGSRGIGRNEGVRLARGEFIAFTDGDCYADPSWLHELREGFRRSDVVAGATVALGRAHYVELGRVELFQQGSDVTFPSCNLGYRRALFERLGGFDPRFITAEDIDLNLRAVRAGATILARPEAIVFHAMRANIARFLVQAYWNGYGRKQLTEKHGSLWGNYRVRRLLETQRSAVGMLRLVAALGGYTSRVLTGGSDRLSEPRRASRAAATAPEGGPEPRGERGP